MALVAVPPDDLARAVGRPVTSYDVEPIDPHLRFHSVTGGLFRVRGDAFSVVVKVVRHGVDDDPGGLWVAGPDVAHRNYWKREWLAYASGVLAALPGRLRAPRLLLATEPAPDECWIWMEDVEGRPGAAWDLDDFARCARDLGTTQGGYAAGAAALPEDEWLSRDWLRGWIDACARLVDALAPDDALRDERVAALRPLRDRVLALWARRDDLLAIVDEAPRTVVHCDLWPTNLFAGTDGTTVAVDWSQVGIGGLGQDLDQTTLDTVWMQVRRDESLDALEDAIVPSYLAGLVEAGCDVTEREVRRWYAAAAGAHYPWMAGVQVTRLRDPVEVAAQEARFGRPFGALVDDRSRVVERALRLGEAVLG